MQRKSKTLCIFIILCILFVTPFLLARYFFTEYRDTLTSTLGTVNKGKLLEPPIVLPGKWEPKWTMLSTSDQTWDKIQRIQLALGKDFSRVAIAKINNIELPANIAANSIFIMDAEHRVILAYPADVNPDDVYRDIERLLKYSAV